MKNIKTITSILALLLVTTSCSKHQADGGSVNTSSIIAKWVFVKSIDWYTSNNINYKDTTTAHTGEYADFRSDGKIYEYFWTSTRYVYDTLGYTMPSSSLLIITYPTSLNQKPDSLNIQTLTSNNLTLYQKSGTDQYWSYFQR